MIANSDVLLEAATAEDAPLLGNLLELYAHDLSTLFPNVRLGPDGRFGYPKLPLYWSQPKQRFAFLIRCAGELAGFILAVRGSPVESELTAMDVAEFFVLRSYRRAGVGRRAARALWSLFPGRWTVRVTAQHREGLSFWGDVVAEAVGIPVKPFSCTVSSTAWQVFAFEPRLHVSQARARRDG